MGQGMESGMWEWDRNCGTVTATGLAGHVEGSARRESEDLCNLQHHLEEGTKKEEERVQHEFRVCASHVA